MNSQSRNLTWHEGEVSAQERENLLRQRGCVVWLTGLSGSGKSTIARHLERRLMSQGHLAYVLDGDNVRHGLNNNLGFSPEDRRENIRRVGEVAALFADAGLVTITAFISPYRSDRDSARSTVGAGRFIEVLVHAPLDVCEERDPKGLYRKARAGEIEEFTGVSAPYEAPGAAEIVLETDSNDAQQCAEIILSHLRQGAYLPGEETNNEV